MKFKALFLLVLFYLPTFVLSQNNTQPMVEAEKEIRKVLTDQVIDWNKGDMEQYMAGYWKSDSLKFIGKSGIQYGWHKTLDGYKKSYPDMASMGILVFTEITIDVLSADAAYVIGKWALERDKGNISGIYTLLFKRINGQWLIVCDHTS